MMKWRGGPEMQRKLRQIYTEHPRRVESAGFIEASIEMTEAKRRTPVDVNYAGGRKPPHPGQLRASGRVHDPEWNGRFMTITMSFGGAAVDYAVWVHEIIENVHPVGQAKFLESTLNESQPYMGSRIAARLKF